MRARAVWASFLFPIALSRVASAAVDAEEPHPSTPEPVEEAPARAPAVPARVLPADEEPARHRTRAVYVLLGFGSPLGGLGLEGVQRFESHFELAAGIGVGDAAAGSEPHPGLGHVVQWALMPRLRFGDDATALTLGAGISGGEYGAGFLRDTFQVCAEDPCPTTNAPYPTQYVVWSNFETGLEHWWRNGLAIRLFAGYAHGFASGDSFNLPYLGFGLGYAF